MDNASLQFSVIITAYNVERYITRAMQSALDQQGVTLEVIVVDDGSTDGTWAAICRHGDGRIKRLRLERNGGPSVARNAAIAQATGQWIAILDGDDAFLPGRLARCLAHAEEDYADIIVDNLMVYREGDNKQFPMFPPNAFERMRLLDLARFIAGNKLFSGGYTLGYLKPLFSAAFLRRHHLAYDPAIRIGEDYVLLAEALACGGRCAVEPAPGYQYSIRSGSISYRLSLADIERMQSLDAQFFSRHVLEPAAAQAQKEREYSLKRAYAFMVLVEAIKQKNMMGAWKAVASCPGCIWLLRMPVEVRLQRILRRVCGEKQ